MPVAIWKKGEACGLVNGGGSETVENYRALSLCVGGHTSQLLWGKPEETVDEASTKEGTEGETNRHGPEFKRGEIHAVC